MAKVEIGQYRDAHLELEHLLRGSGPILENALHLAVKIHAPYFTQNGPNLRHRTTDQTIEQWVEERRKTAPQDYADFTPDDPDQLLHLYTQEAFGETCSPKTVTRLYQFMNDPVRFAALAKAWNCDPVKMIPGKRPGTGDDSDGEKKPARAPLSSNPFSTEWHGSEEARTAKINSLYRVGTEFPEGLRKAARVAGKAWVGK